MRSPSNGVSSGGWIKYPGLIEQAGAGALELNVYFVPTDPDLTGAQIEQALLTWCEKCAGVCASRWRSS